MTRRLSDRSVDRIRQRGVLLQARKVVILEGVQVAEPVGQPIEEPVRTPEWKHCRSAHPSRDHFYCCCWRFYCRFESRRLVVFYSSPPFLFFCPFSLPWGPLLPLSTATKITYFSARPPKIVRFILLLHHSSFALRTVISRHHPIKNYPWTFHTHSHTPFSMLPTPLTTNTVSEPPTGLD